MKNSIPKRLLALLLCMAMLVPYLDALPLKAWAASGETGTSSEAPLAVIAAGSDFQYLNKDNIYNGVVYDDIYAANGALLKDILQQMKADDHPSLDAYFMCGDYDGDEYVYDTSSSGIAAAYSALNEVYGLTYDQIQFVQGNHDPANAENLDATGDYDTDYYGVYQINEDDFPWGSNAETTANAAAGLKEYLDEKVAAGYRKPIFVITHLPLHHSFRMNGSRTDNSYARYLVDVLNEAGAAGLNIVFMFGHNHSGAYDAYLGRDCIYLLPGTTIPVTDPETGTADTYDDVTLNFTYMNPGYVGYSADVLTSTVFEIYEDRMEVTRYSRSGVEPLKKAGYSSGNAAETWAPDTTVLESPYTQSLSELALSVVSSTLGNTLAPDATARIQIGVQSEDTYNVSWEIIGDELITLTQDPADPTVATLTGVTYGTTAIKVTVRNAEDPGAVPATMRFDVTVAQDGAVKFNDAENSSLYKLVTDWSTLTTNKKYMILNRDTAGFAVAMAGPENTSDRDHFDPASVLTRPTVFAVNGEDGLYTAPVNGEDIWELKLYASDPQYFLHQVSNTASFVAVSKRIDTAMSYDYACGYRFASGYTSGGAARWTVDTVNKAFNLHSYYKSGDYTEPAAPTGLYYNSSNRYFEISTEASGPVHIYEWTGMQGPDMWMWLTSDSGNITLNGNDVEGAKVVVMTNGQITEVPISTEMLVGAYPEVPGTRTCSVYCYGQLVSDQFQISVTSEDGTVIRVATLLENNGDLYRYQRSDLDGSSFVTVNRKTAGDGKAMTVALVDGEYRLVPMDVEVVSIDGLDQPYVKALNDGWVWDQEHYSGNHYYLKSRLAGKYLRTSGTDLVLVDTIDADGRWRVNSTDYTLTEYVSNLIIELGDDGYIAAERVNYGVGVGYTYVKDTQIDRVLAYMTDYTGTTKVGGSGALLTGETITKSFYYQDGNCVTEEIPVTMEMLDISPVDLCVPGDYVCSITYNGQVICDNFLLTVEGNEGEIVADTPVIFAEEGTIYKRVQSMAAGNSYVVVNTKVAGPAYALSVTERDGGYAFPAEPVNTFTVDGLTESDGTSSVFVVARDDSWVFTTQASGVSGRFFLYNDRYQHYLYSDTSHNLQFVETKPPASTLNWRYSGTQSAMASGADGIPTADGGDYYVLYQTSVAADKRAQIYLLDDSIKTIVAYVDGLEGEIAVGSEASAVGGNVVIRSILKDGSLDTQTVPITLDMLDISPIELLTPGRHTCPVVYDGKVISEKYVLTITSTVGAPAEEPVEITDQFYKRVTAETEFVAGGTYVLVDTDTNEAAHVMTVEETADGYRIAVANAAVFAINGSQYIAVNDDSWIWTTAKHTDGISLRNQISGLYLGGTNDDQLVLRDAPSSTYGWRYTSSFNVATTSTSIPEGASSAKSSDITFRDDVFGLTIRNAANTAWHVYPYKPDGSVDGMVIYPDALSGQCAAASDGATQVGGNLIVNTLANGVTGQQSVPITLDMLNLTAHQRLVPGTYTCALSYAGQLLSENYEITILPQEGEKPAATEAVVLVAEDDKVFSLYNSGYDWVEHGTYMFVDTEAAGEATVVGVTPDGQGGYIASPQKGYTFTVGDDGNMYIVASAEDQIWSTQKSITTDTGAVATQSNARFYVKNTAYGKYLFVNDDYDLLLTDANTAGTINNGWRASSKALVTGEDALVYPYADLGARGPRIIARYRKITSGNTIDTFRIYVHEQNFITSLAYLDQATGTADVNSIDTHACGGNIVIKTIMADGSVVTDTVPITMDMLQLSYGEKHTAGTHTCEVVYRGKVICSDYILTVTDDAALPQADAAVVLFENNDRLFKRVLKISSFKQYVFVDSRVEGPASAMTLAEDKTFPAADTKVFTIDGGTDLYVVAEDSNWIWNTEQMYNAQGKTAVFTLFSPDTGEYLHVNDQGVLLMVPREEAPPNNDGWHYAGANRTLGNGSSSETPYITVRNLNGVFQATDRYLDGSDTNAAYIYEVDDVFEGQVAYVTSLEGSCNAGSSYDIPVGGSVVVKTYQNDGTVTTQEIPIDLSMIDGIEPLELFVAGEHTCSVVYQGKVLTDSYVLTVESDGSAAASTPVELANQDDLIFKRVTDLKPGEQYVFVTTREAGMGYVLAVVMEDGVFVLDDPQAVVTDDGIHEITVAKSNAWVWDAVARQAGQVYLYNGNADQYLLAANADFLTLGQTYDEAYGWRISGTENLGINTGPYYTDVVNNGDGFYMQQRHDKDFTGHTYAYERDDTVELVLGYMDALTGEITVGQTGLVHPGGNVIVKTFYADGNSGNATIPVTLDMLDLTLTQLNTPGEYTCTVTYDGQVITDEYILTVTGEEKTGMMELPGDDPTVLGYLSMLSGNVSDELPVGSGGRIPTGNTIQLYTYYADGTVTLSEEPVTVDMLNVTTEQLNTPGTYSGLNLTYKKLQITDDYTLKLSEVVQDDYPDFPHEGSVRVDKQMDTTKYDYLQTGSAQIDLSMTGIPTTSKANVVIVLDASSSMTACTHGVYNQKLTEEQTQIIQKMLDMEETLTQEEIDFLGTLDFEGFGEPEEYMARIQKAINRTITDSEMISLKTALRLYGYCYHTDKWVGNTENHCKTRVQVTKDALEALLNYLQNDIHGYSMDIDVAISYFNQYYPMQSDLIFLNNQGQQAIRERDPAEIMLSFTDIDTLDIPEVIERFKTTSGTNYDRGMEIAYQQLSEKQTQDYLDYLASGSDVPFQPRKDFVLFMSDGAPGQLNYMVTNNAAEFSNFYNGKLKGDLGQYVDASVLDIFTELYHPEGKMWLAEAIKGDKTQTYKVIDPTMPETNYVSSAPGLGATMMTVALNASSAGGILTRIASGEDYYYPTETGDDIQAAFNAFGSLVASASGAAFIDQMGPEFDLQTANTITPSNIKDMYVPGNDSWETFNGEQTTRTVYFDGYGKNWSHVKVYTWDASGTLTGAWPGSEMTHLGNGVFAYQVPAGVKNIIFSDGGGSGAQTADLTLPANASLFRSSDSTWHSYDTRTVYFDASGCDWSSIYAYTWGGSGISTTGNWPGTKMIHLGGSIYSYEIPADATGIKFSDNGGSQTGNLTVPANEANLYRFSSNSWDTYKTRTIYFNNAGKNWDTVCAYTWDENGYTTSAWHGMPMTHIGGGIYSCEIPADAKDMNFNNGVDQQTANLTVPPTTISLNSTITVSKYELYKYSEHLHDPENITMDMVGKRKETAPAVLEQITFSDDGTEAYSNLIDGGKTNILIDGVICAQYFWYNTNTGKSVMIDANRNGTPETLLESETFYWSIDSIPEDELVLSYNVYLTGTLEGTRGEGSYATNNYATLHYTNHLGNDCELNTTSPMLPWNQAVVGYAFYLVDANGNPIVNEDKHLTGSFEQSVRMTQPLYIDLLYNSAENVTPWELKASDVLPEGYSLYDAAAAYHVALYANGEGSWLITGDKPKQTTYVTGYGGTPTTQVSATAGMSTGQNTYDYPAYATSSTVVWFAVRADVNAVPDTVVIDYGISVDIHVLGNDVVITDQNSVIAGLSSTGPEDANGDGVIFTGTLADGFSGSYQGAFGKATILGDVVRYTPDTMQMTAEDTFYYSANYRGEKNSGYYYAAVTVIPATSIYFEDNYITFDGNWTQVGQTVSGAVQDEDRLGSFSLPQIDANNVYGYDSAYANMTTWSMGSAMKATLDATNCEAIAEFTFTGTGFDIISFTGTNTGTLMLTVQGITDPSVSKFLVVDSYYSMSDGLYQVPIMKMKDLPYGEYWVELYVGYGSYFDHQGDGSYEFYLDAIRIYDTANDGEGNQLIQDAYVSDNEGWPSYQELRNILITVETFDALGKDDEIEGAIFIDSNAALDESAIATYVGYGPNNEVYLAPGQAIAFDLNVYATDENVAGIHLGLKSVGGTAVAKVYNAAVNHSTVKEQRLSSATGQYFDISQLDGHTVVIWNVGGEGDAILSVTDLKTTYKHAPKDTGRSTFRIARSSAEQVLASMGAPAAVEPVLTPKFPTLSFESEVVYNVYFATEGLDNVAMTDMGLVIFDSTGTQLLSRIPGAVQEGELYMVHTEGIPAKTLGDEVYFKVYADLANGTAIYSDLYSYSAVTYARSVLNTSTNTEQKALVVAMLNYGAKAQEYFGYRTDSLMNSWLTAEQKAMSGSYQDDLVSTPAWPDSTKLSSELTAANGGFKQKQPTVTFGERFRVNYYFTPENAVEGTMMLYYWDLETYMNEQLSYENAVAIPMQLQSDGRYLASGEPIAARELNDAVYAMGVYEADGVCYSTGVLPYSVAQYCKMSAGGGTMAELAQATVVYGSLAADYFDGV